jgi:hypothetical protein
LVEQLIRNQQVVGSSPTFGSSFKFAAICKMNKGLHGLYGKWPLGFERPFGVLGGWF